MAEPVTSVLQATLINTGDLNNTWGGTLNTNVIQVLEDAIVNTLSTAASAGALGPSNILDLTAGTDPSNARWAVLIFTGAITANQVVKVPNANKTWYVINATSGAYTVTMQTGSPSATAVIPQNSSMQIVRCDGSNNVYVSPFNWKQIQMPDGSAVAPAYSYVNEPSSGWYRYTTNDLRLSVAATDVVQVTPLGLNIIGAQLYFNAVAFDQTATVPSGVETFYAGITAPSGWLFCYGQAVSRTTYSGLLTAISALVTGASTHGNTTIDGYGVDLRGLGLEGSTVEITGAASGVTVVTVNSGSIITSSAISGSSSGLTLRLCPFGSDWPTNSTFNLPDRRGRSIFGRDNMGGTAAGRVTSTASSNPLGIVGASSGVSGGNQLGATGGEQVHTLTSPGEIPAHAHTITDSGHTHTFAGDILINQNSAGASHGVSATNAISGPAFSITSATTGITINSTGSSGAHNTIPPASISNVIIKV